MVQIIDDPNAGNIFGRIGKGLAKGLSEQLPKEIERGRLSAGLKNIAGNKDLSEVERYAELLKLPGGAEHAGMLIPALQRSGQNKAFLEEGEVQPEPFQGTIQAPQAVQNIPVEKVSSKKTALTSPEE